MAIDDIADELYALAPEEFTAARDDAARSVAGEDRKAVKSLRKPTVAAYAVNMLVRTRSGDVDALVGLGEEMRAAMTGAGDLRALTEQRRTLVGDLVHAASAVTGRELTAGVEEDVAATLEAATADPELGSAVRSGRLVKPLRYAGFGALPDLTDAVATPLPRRPSRPAKSAGAPAGKTPTEKSPVVPPTKKTSTRASAPPSPELTKLRERVLELSGLADDAQRRYDEAGRAVQQARELLEAAENERAEARKAAGAAHKEAERARRDLGRLERS